MAINQYTRPMAEVFQQLEAAQTLTNSYLAAVVLGPQYVLQRYGIDDLAPTPFNSAEETIPYVYPTSPLMDYSVDTASVQVYAENLEASLATWTSKCKLDTPNNMIVRTGDPTKLFAGIGEGGKTLLTELNGLGVQIGDVLYVTQATGGTPVRGTVTGLAGAVAPSTASYGTASPFNTTPEGKTAPKLDGATADIKPTNMSGAYTGDTATSYILTCTKLPTDLATSWKGAEFEVTDTAGVDVVTYIAVTSGVTSYPAGTKGLSITFTKTTANMGISIGNSYMFAVQPAKVSTTQFDGVMLDTIPVDLGSYVAGTALQSVELRKTYTGKIPSDAAPNAAWTATPTSVNVASGMSMYLPGRTASRFVPFVNAVGNLFVAFRVLVIPDADEDIFTLTSIEDITTAFGPIDMQNTIAYGAWACLVAAGNRAIYAIRTQGTGVNEFVSAVRKTESNSDCYNFAILSEDHAVVAAVNTYNDSMSTPQAKKWRSNYCGITMPGTYVLADTDADGAVLNATVSADASGNNVIVQISPSNVFDLRAISFNGTLVSMSPGDYVSMFGRKYTIKTILSARDMILVAGPETPISPAQPIALLKADTPANAIEYVTGYAAGFGSRRMNVIWCDGGTNADESPTPIPAMYMAAEVAGFASALFPQAGLTRQESQLVTAAPRMYTKYTQSQLDKIAASGVMIYTQDSKGTPVYIRHQLTTETDKGLLYYENSCTRTGDMISYKVADIVNAKIGKTNVVPSLLRSLKQELTFLLNSLTDDDTAGELIGPPVVSWYNLIVEQNKTVLDEIDVYFTAEIPVPANNIKVYEGFVAARVTL